MLLMNREEALIKLETNRNEVHGEWSLDALPISDEKNTHSHTLKNMQ